MPIYDYTCSSCGHLTEVVHGIHEAGPKFCPECGAEGTMTKAFAAPAIHFKGSGWAKKDRSTSSKPAARKDEATSTAGASVDSGSGSSAASTAGDSVDSGPTPTGSSPQAAAGD